MDKVKESTLSHVAKYEEYAKRTDVHVPPTFKISSGAHGTNFELQCKLAIGNYKFKHVAPAYAPDTTKVIDGKKMRFEFKVGAGEIATLQPGLDFLENEENEKARKIDETNINEYLERMTYSILRSDLIVYAPTYNPKQEATRQAYVISPELLIDILIKTGLLRTKKSSSQYRKEEGMPTYCDKLAIQSFNASPKREQKLRQLLDKNGMKFDKWIEKNL